MILYRKNKKFYSKLSLECLFFFVFVLAGDSDSDISVFWLSYKAAEPSFSMNHSRLLLVNTFHFVWVLDLFLFIYTVWAAGKKCF